MKNSIIACLLVTLLFVGRSWAQDEGRGRHRDNGNGRGAERGSDRSNGWGGGEKTQSADNTSEEKVKQEKPRKHVEEGTSSSGNGPAVNASGRSSGTQRHHFSGSSNNNGTVTDPSVNSQSPSNGGVRNRGTHHFNRTTDGTNPSNEGKVEVSPRRGHSTQSGRNLEDRPSVGAKVRVSEDMRKIGVRRVPERILDKSHILNAPPERSKFTPPSVGPGGENMKVRVLEPKKADAARIQGQMRAAVNNTTFVNQINVYNSRETVANRYYWHDWNGSRYCHYYDNWGYHWYGWYWHGSCFWSRWYSGNWWWYDPYYYRWCYWYDGYWWWQDPYHVNVVYVYNDGRYVSSGSDARMEAPSSSAEVDYRSKDGSRTVKIFGNDAFLYDTDQDGVDNAPIYLASNVREVKFSRQGNGKPLQIMLMLEDGSFELFDSDGNPYNNSQD
jgi:hypothetical protein